MGYPHFRKPPFVDTLAMRNSLCLAFQWGTLSPQVYYKREFAGTDLEVGFGAAGC